ncbi:MAG TPA: sigma-70 family RNA polymerase sigma factor [Kofleriaceae bacterium]|nr:sigma-70 family RNA polymerase sigma factor [Kofleriaceae bacterium]
MDEAELCRTFAPRIRLYGLRHLDGTAAADDLVQEVLVIVIEAVRAGRVREPERIASYVLGTCRQVAQGGWRGERRRGELLAQHGELLAPDPSREPVIDVDRLRGCLAALAERERTIVVLSFYDERDADDIAIQLGMTSGNVRVVRHRAVARLRACMGDA